MTILYKIGAVAALAVVIAGMLISKFVFGEEE